MQHLCFLRRTLTGLLVLGLSNCSTTNENARNSAGGSNGQGGTPDSAGAGTGTGADGSLSPAGGAGAQGGAASRGGASHTAGGTRSSGGRAGSAGNTTMPQGGSSGGSRNTGGSGATGPGSGGTAAQSCPLPALSKLITTSEITTPEGVKPGTSNFRIWGSSSLNISPVYTTPLSNCGTLVCYTTGAQAGSKGTRTARVARLDANDQLVTTHDLGAFECRGLAAEPDGHFAALLWEPGKATDCADIAQSGKIYVQRFDVTGKLAFSKELTNTSTAGLGPNCPTDWGIGESRLEFGNGKYGAYYHVHSKSGHEGDTLKYVDLTGAETTKWSWGCSHSMSNLLRYSSAVKDFLPACVTDCYPGTGDDLALSIGGVYISNKNKVMDLDGGCDGSVAGELGGGAVSPTGWNLVFNGHQAPATTGTKSYDKATMNQDIAFASVGNKLTASGSVVWLTTTPAINEADSAIERFQSACDTTEQYLVGWAEPGAAYKYKLARVGAAGAFLEEPVDITTVAQWGRRDDPFRAQANGDVVWAWFSAPGSTALHFARVRSGGTAQCAAF